MLASLWRSDCYHLLRWRLASAFAWRALHTPPLTRTTQAWRATPRTLSVGAGTGEAGNRQAARRAALARIKRVTYARRAAPHKRAGPSARSSRTPRTHSASRCTSTRAGAAC